MWKFLFSSLKSLALVTFFTSATLLSLNAHNSYLYNSIGNEVVKITNDLGGGGTGFHVQTPKGKVYILTNKHVCKAATNSQGYVNVQTQNGENMKRKIVEMYKRHDLCLVEPMGGYEGLELTDKKPLNSNTYVIGHPGLRPLTISSGHYIGDTNIKLSEINVPKAECEGEYRETDEMTRIFFGVYSFCENTYQTITTDNVIYGGNSGSPMVDAWGNVWGVVFAGRRDTPNNAHIVPVSYVNDFLKNY